MYYAVDGGNMFKRRITNCARCGEDHDEVDVKKFTKPFAGTFTHWAMCPKLNEPILITDLKV